MDDRNTLSPIGKIASSPQFKLFLKKLAVMGVIITIIGLIMKLYGIKEGETLLVSAMSALALVAFFAGYIPCPYENFHGVWNFVMKLTGYSLGAAIIGLLFSIMHWSGSSLMLIVGAVGLVFCAILWIWFYSLLKKNSNKQ
jgi:hypothetical protein